MSDVCELWLLQGGGEAKTLTPKQCIIIDAGLETIKVGGDLHIVVSRKTQHGKCPTSRLLNLETFIRFFGFIKYARR